MNQRLPTTAQPQGWEEKYAPNLAPEIIFRYAASPEGHQIVKTVANKQLPLTADEILLECRDLDRDKAFKVLEEAVQFGLLFRENGKYLPSKPVGFGWEILVPREGGEK